MEPSERFVGGLGDVVRRFALLTLLSCQSFYDSSADVNAVLLITVGGMNAEQVNAGTPHLHTLARSGQYWPRAYAASPMTLEGPGPRAVAPEASAVHQEAPADASPP